MNRVVRLIKIANIRSKIARRFVITKNSKNTAKPAPDLLKRQFQVSRSNKAWVSDTTFIGTREGWLYLVVVLNLFSRKVVGWAMGNSNNGQLVKNALNMAIHRRKSGKNVLVHSDQASSYASREYHQLLNSQNFCCSMSRKGECLDNAVAESFFGTLKNELVFDEDYKTRSQAD